MRALVLLLLSGCFSRGLSIDPPGTLPGEAIWSVQAGGDRVATKTVDSTGTTVSREGQLTTLRVSAGTFGTLTRFGTMSGIEGSVGFGYLSGSAARLDDLSEQKNLYGDFELGGVVQPFYVAPKGVLLRLAGDFGVGFNQDDKFTYAGARVGTGAKNRGFAIDASVRRHFGDTPGNEGAHEDRGRVTVSIRPNAGRRVWQLSAEYVRGDKRTIDMGREMGRDDYVLRGRYEMIGISLGVGGAIPWQGPSSTVLYD